MAKCENCDEHIRQRLATSHDSDDLIDITFFPAQEAGERMKSVPRNYYCSVDCAIEGLRERQPQKATREEWERREELIDETGSNQSKSTYQHED